MLLDTGQNKLHGGVVLDGVELVTEQHTEFPLVVGAVGRQVMDAARLADGLVAEGLQGGEVTAVRHTHAGGQFLDAGQGACPDDIVDVVVVGEEIIFAIVTVEHTYQVFALKAEEIEKGAVLTEPIGVVGVIAGCFVVALDDDKPVAYVLAQLFTTGDISLFFEHVDIFLVIHFYPV